MHIFSGKMAITTGVFTFARFDDAGMREKTA